jgi:hypothetical protein
MRARVDDTRRHLNRLRVALATPSPRGIEEALPDLAQAVASMKELERELERGEKMNSSMALELIALSREIGIVRRLTDRGLELCNGWAVLLATAAGGYVASGKPAPLRPASTLRIEG